MAISVPEKKEREMERGREGAKKKEKEEKYSELTGK